MFIKMASTFVGAIFYNSRKEMHMKRTRIVLLIVIFCLSLCACKGGTSVEKDLLGTWKHTWHPSGMGYESSTLYEFDKHGSVTCKSILDGKETVTYGRYTIEKDCVTVCCDDQNTVKLAYYYDSGVLSLVNYGDGSMSQRFYKIS